MSAGRESYITIQFAGKSPSGKTSLFEVIAVESGGLLGSILWYGPWRSYAFEPLALTVFEQRCLREIADFCERETKAHRAVRRENRAATRLPTTQETARRG